jgi:hypothetical protein
VLVHLFRDTVLTSSRYRESIDLLYTHNVLDINQIFTLLSFHEALPTHRWNTIRALRFYAFIPYNYYAWPGEGASLCHGRAEDRTWVRTCELLASMKGLRHLKIVIEGFPDDWDEQNLKNVTKFIQPLVKIKVPGTFTVAIPWPSHAAEDAILAAAPFRLVRSRLKKDNTTLQHVKRMG